MVWNVRVLAVSAKKDGWRPGIMLGTGSVRIGDSHQSLYLQLFKSFEISENFTLSLNSGVATLFPDFNKAYVLAGASVMVYKKFSAYVHYDGRNFFPGISWPPWEWLNLSLILIENRDLAISTGINWKLK